jgi:hypothetical protein
MTGCAAALLLLAACGSKQAAPPAAGPLACQPADIQGRLAQEDCGDPNGALQLHITAFLGATDTGRVDLTLTKANQQALVWDIPFQGDTAQITVPAKQPDGTSNGGLAGVKLAVTRENAWTYSVERE